MSKAQEFEPKIVAYVCNWCTYLGADLAGTARLEYPPNVRIIRLPCTGRIDFNLIIKALEVGADGVLVSGCHPGDCHYTAGNYHARRRWILFRELLDTLGIDLRRIQFTWISAAEGRKWQQVVTEFTEQTRKLGPYKELYATGEFADVPAPETLLNGTKSFAVENELREVCRKLLAEGTVKVVIGYGAHGPVVVIRPEETERLVWNNQCFSNLTAYLKRKEIKSLGKAAVIVKPCDEKSLVELEKESQFQRKDAHVIGMACEGVGQPKCARCTARTPRFADVTLGVAAGPERQTSPSPNRFAALMAMPPAERMAFWAEEFNRCVKCYACRQVCPMCYCERCIVTTTGPLRLTLRRARKETLRGRLPGRFIWRDAAWDAASVRGLVQRALTSRC